MKALIMSAAILAAPAFATDRELEINVDGGDEVVSIDFSTKRTFSSMCFMSITDLQIRADGRDSLVGRRAMGAIKLTAEVNPLAMCMTAFGPHRGSIEFERGQRMPELADGSYELSINGENYGVLEIGDTVELVEQDEERVVVAGILSTGISAIGGETTGIGLFTSKYDMVELSMDLEEAQSYEGMKVVVSGTYIDVYGVETGVRQVLKVQSIKPVHDDHR